MRGWLLFLAAAVALVFGTAAAEAGKRVALVVGNGAYAHTRPLANPVNDARDVAAALRGLGFEVFEGLDLTEADFAHKVRDFARAARGAEAALFYYAGHGLQMEGQNYLVPIDARLSDEADLAFEAVELNDVVRLMERAAPARLVFLDACRDNPLAQGLAHSLGATRSASVGRGLAAVERAAGTLIAYATQPGNVAVDGTGRNSPFTAAFLKNLETPGLEVNQLLTRVRQSVLAATGRQQTPWTHSALEGDFYFAPAEEEESETAAPERPTEVATAGAGNAAAPQSLSSFDERQLELAFWQSIEDSEDWRDFQAYLDLYGEEGTFRVLAERRRDQFKEREKQQKLKEVAAAEEQPAAEESGEAAAQETGESMPAVAEQPLSRRQIRSVQAALAKWGYDPGPADGISGKRTTAAVRQYQADWQLPETGQLSAELLARLERKHPDTESRWQKTVAGGCQVWNEGPLAKETASWSGDCQGGKASGVGKLLWTWIRKGDARRATYEGVMLAGKEHGHGVYVWANGDRYEGDWVKGDFSGHGVYVAANGNRYEGDWVKGKRTGHGVFVWANGNRYEGDWVKSEISGRGVYVWANGDRYEGNWVKGKHSGHGVLVWANGSRCQGSWTNGRPDGHADCLIDGERYVGVWRNGCFKQGDWTATVGVTRADCGF